MITRIKWQKFNNIDSFDSENVFDGQAYFNGGAAAVAREWNDEDYQGEYHAGGLSKSEYQEAVRDYQSDYAAANARAMATKAKNRGENYKKAYNAKNKQYMKTYSDREAKEQASDDQHRKEVAAWQKKQATKTKAAPAPVKKTIAKKATTTRKTVATPIVTAARPDATRKKPAAKKVPAKTSKKK